MSKIIIIILKVILAIICVVVIAFGINGMVTNTYDSLENIIISIILFGIIIVFLVNSIKFIIKK